VPEEDQDLAVGLLSTYNFSGIEEKHDEMTITFSETEWYPNIRQDILNTLIEVIPSTKILKEESILDKDWNEEWEKNVQSIRVNDRIGIAPTWRIDELDTEIKIAINPKMSFGTGDHATTRLVCRMMEGNIGKDTFWIDAGTGTGVLAILAIKLGAARVLAFDNNIWSIENAIENIELNKVNDRIDIEEWDIDIAELPQADGIVANLFAHLLISAFGKFHSALKDNKGTLIASGLLIYDLDDIIKEAVKSGFRFEQTLIEDEWAAVRFTA